MRQLIRFGAKNNPDFFKLHPAVDLMRMMLKTHPGRVREEGSTMGGVLMIEGSRGGRWVAAKSLSAAISQTEAQYCQTL